LFWCSLTLEWSIGQIGLRPMEKTVSILYERPKEDQGQDQVAWRSQANNPDCCSVVLSPTDPIPTSRQPAPNVFQPDARHFDSSTFCALLGGAGAEPGLENQDKDDGRGRPRRGHYYSWELPAFVSQNKNQLRAFLRSVSTHDWLLAKLIHTFVLLLMNVCSVVMTTLTVNDFTFKNVAMQLCNFPNQYPKSTLWLPKAIHSFVSWAS